MSLMPGTERAIFNISQELPRLEQSIDKLARELQRINDREDADRADIISRQTKNATLKKEGE